MNSLSHVYSCTLVGDGHIFCIIVKWVVLKCIACSLCYNECVKAKCMKLHCCFFHVQRCRCAEGVPASVYAAVVLWFDSDSTVEWLIPWHFISFVSLAGGQTSSQGFSTPPSLQCIHISPPPSPGLLPLHPRIGGGSLAIPFHIPWCQSLFSFCFWIKLQDRPIKLNCLQNVPWGHFSWFVAY